jgi:mono/diheme cytochrome c family protein
MKPKTKKVLLAVTLTPAVLLLGVIATVLVRSDRRFDAPLPDLHASDDPRVIERGRYLAYGLAHCVDCHANPGDRAAKERGEQVPLSGGQEFRLPVGVIRARNITPDQETGIGRYTDPEIARILRYGVHADGRVVLPFMPFANLADDDLVALISFLRSQKPVRHLVPPQEPNLLGKAVLAFVLTPQGPSEPLRRSFAPEPSAEYGRYLALNVGNCVKCHTRIDMRTGKYAGPLFAGGAEHAAEGNPQKKYISPNLTPDPRWGWLNGWSEDAFVGRFRAGPVHTDSPMPWRAFRNVSDNDARAIYRFLRTLPPAAGGPDPERRQVVAENTGTEPQPTPNRVRRF